MTHTSTRKGLRFPVRLPVLCDGQAIPSYCALGLTQNVSRGGLMVEVHQLLTPGICTGLLLSLGNQNAQIQGMVTRLTLASPVVQHLASQIETEAEVIWIRVARQGRDVRHGLHFRSYAMGKELFMIGALLLPAYGPRLELHRLDCSEGNAIGRTIWPMT